MRLLTYINKTTLLSLLTAFSFIKGIPHAYAKCNGEFNVDFSPYHDDTPYPDIKCYSLRHLEEQGNEEYEDAKLPTTYLTEVDAKKAQKTDYQRAQFFWKKPLKEAL